MPSSLIQVILFFGSALMLVVPDGYTGGGIVLCLLGIVLLAKRSVTLAESAAMLAAHPAALAFIAFATLNFSLNLYHGGDWLTIGSLIPFLFYPFILLVFIRTNPDPRYFWRGAAVGAIGSLIFAAYQVVGLGLDRAGGFTNQIKFGNTAVVLATASLIGFIYAKFERHERLEKALLLIGGVCGMLASLLSGSKGGWLSILIVSSLIFHSATKSFGWRKKFLLIGLIVTLLATGITLVARNQVIDRISSGIAGATTWFQTGQVTEYSVSVRLELWKAGLQIGAQYPWLGAGDEQFLRMIQESVDTGRSRPEIEHINNLHNELIGFFAEKGLVGVLSVLMVHTLTFLMFYRSRHHPDRAVRALSMMGMLLVFLYIEFGLSMAIFGVNAFRQVYTAWTMILAGLIYSQSRHALIKPAY